MSATTPPMFAPKQTDWHQRLRDIVETMREMSRQTDPMAMSRAYGNRVRNLFPMDRFLSLSRRGLERPHVRVTRYSGWQEDINPWLDKERLPSFSGGLLAELIYSDEPWVIDDLKLDPGDP